MKIAILLLTLWSIDLSYAIEGKATMYGGNLNGNACGMQGTADAFSNSMFAAIGSDNFDSGYGCGKCYTVRCTGAYGNNPTCSCDTTKTITIQAIDQCPECSNDHFDFNTDVMVALTGNAGMAGTCGVISIDYNQVDCDDITGNFQVVNKGGTSQYWYGLHLNDVNDDGGVSAVNLYKDGSKVGYCNKNQGPSFWICTATQGTFPATPLDIEITGYSGKSVTAYGCITSYDGGAEMRCNTNLGGGDGGGNTPKPTPRPVAGNTPVTQPTEKPVSSGGGSGKLKITNKNGLNQWWYAVVLDNVPSAGIEWVKMKANGMSTWEQGEAEWDYVKFTKYKPYSPPFSFKVKSKSGQTIRTSNVIKTLNEGDFGYMGTEFSSSYTEEDGDNTSTFPVAGIIAIVLLLIIIIGVAGYCFIKRRKQKAAVSFNGGDNYAAGDTPTGKAGENKTAGYDMSTIDVEVEANDEATR